MIKSKLKDGTPFFGIKIELFVTKTVFANAIASYCWANREDFDTEMTKTTAMKILKDNLFQQGVGGLNRDQWDGASQEFVAPFEDNYKAAIEWIDKNYPYLK